MEMNWQWLAGFFEGEGHIQYVEGKKGTTQGTGGRIIIGQKDKRALEAIKKYLEILKFTHILFSQRSAKPPRMPNPLWILSICERENVIRFLVCIEPLLYEKKKKALWVLNNLRALNKKREERLGKALKMRQQKICWRDICRKLHISPHTLYNHARAQGIELKKKYRADSFSWRQDRVERGLCGSCGKQRKGNGTKQECRKCADITNKRSQEWKRKWRQKQLLLKT